MLTEEDIRRTAGEKGVLAYFVEKEYLQHLFLSSLSRESRGFVLKGASCLRIAYGYERYSRTLELNSSLPPEEARAGVLRALEAMSSAVKHRILSERLHGGRYEVMVEFWGPLSQGASKMTNILVISVAPGSTLLEPWEPKVSSSFTPAFQVKAMQEKEILAEKVLSLARNRDPRDAYDVWCMLRRGVELDWSLAQRKSSQLGVEFVKPSPPFCGKEEYGEALKNTLPSLPPYEQVMRELEKQLIGGEPVEIKLERNYRLYLILAALIIGVFASAYSVIHSGQRDAYTVLYFSNPAQPFYYNASGKSLLVNFTLENHEGREVSYVYHVTLFQGEETRRVEAGIALQDGETRTVSQVFQEVDASKPLKVAVELYLKGSNESYRRIWYGEEDEEPWDKYFGAGVE